MGQVQLAMERDEDDANGSVDGLLWHKDLGHHIYGQFSMAVMQANYFLEDESQFESGPLTFNDLEPSGTFIGVYDGHGGPQASRYIAQNLLSNLKKFATMHKGISENVIRNSYAATEEGFLSLVQKKWLNKPEIASAGSCCLIGIICYGFLYIANAGDSRVVLGKTVRATQEVIAVQLSTEHNASIESVRQELRSIHPEDPHIVVQKHNAWRVKGIIQVSRSIGDAYLKKAEFNREPLLPKFRLPEPFHKPIISAEPTISVHKLCPEDRFLVFASDGLWEHLNNDKVVDIVNSTSRNVSR